MNSESEAPQEQLAALGADRLGGDPGQQQAGEIAEGQPGFPHGSHDQGVGAVDPLVLQPAAEVGAGQGAERHQPRHEAKIGVRFAGPDQLVHLIEAGEVAPRLGRGLAERSHEPLPGREVSPGRGQTGWMSQRFSFAS